MISHPASQAVVSKLPHLEVEQSAPIRVLRRKALLERVPYSPAHLYRLIRDGRFPRPIRLGEASVGWLEHEVDQWLAERIAERDRGEAK
jgi:prophage regulatory protein